MRKISLLPLFFGFAWLGSAFAATPTTVMEPAARNAPPPAIPPAVVAAELSTSDAIILGIVEGVTEFLPVSSTGHLIIATSALGLESEQPLTDATGKKLWAKLPSAERKPGLLTKVKSWAYGLLGRVPVEAHPDGIPLTTKIAADTFTIVIQFGAIAAVALLYWTQLLSMLNGLLGRDAVGRRLLINVIVAFLPAAVIGLLAHDWIDEHLFSVSAVIFAQIAGALFMWWAESRRRALISQSAPPMTAVAPTKPPLLPSDLTVGQSVRIGLLQCVAMWPGTSRSMMTIVGGYFAGLDPRGSAEFSFLLGFVTLTAATVYKSYSNGAAMIAVFGWSHVLLGCVIATITAAFSVKFLVNWLVKHGLMLFVWYRFAFAALLVVLLAAGLFK